MRNKTKEYLLSFSQHAIVVLENPDRFITVSPAFRATTERDVTREIGMKGRGKMNISSLSFNPSEAPVSNRRIMPCQFEAEASLGLQSGHV